MLRSRYQRWLAFSLALVSAITFAACNPTQMTTQAAQKSQVVFSILSDPKTFNYALSQESPNIFGLTYDGLTTEDGDGKVVPALAEKWDISDDKLKIIFTLKKYLKWSDGQPLTVDDVIFTYNDVYLNEAVPTDTRDVLRVGQKRLLPQVKKLDEQRVEFSVPEPFSPFLRVTGLPILPKHALEESIKTKDEQGKLKFLSTWGINTPPEKIIVNGPYKLESYSTSERLVYLRNPYYWRKDTQGNQQPYIERVIWQIVPSTETSLLQFRSGGLDSLGVSPEYFSLLNGEKKRGKFTIYGVKSPEPAPGTIFISFNLNKANRNGKPLVDPVKSQWFNNLKFRQAVAYGIDRQRMITNIFRGLGEVQDSPITFQSPYYLSRSEGLKSYDYNPQKAKELLLAGGFKYNGENELIDVEGNAVRFSLITNGGNKIREAMGTQIKQDLEKIGIQVDFNPIDFGLLVDKLSNTLDWDCHLLGFTGGAEPNDGANIWSPEGGLHSFNQKALSGQTPIEGRKIADWEQKIGDLYIKASQEFDEKKRKALYAETQQLTQEYLPYIHLVNAYTMSAVRDRITGIKFSALNGAFWNIYELKVSEK
ncbi:ABC transporter substrate-binding protein [Merismopedia glauca]|uniref:Peptide ABC transporter substrate-binding protein n=1 Tax=Merismopedia glauca CCAP 1448/3 TaxID=1296344 RepID=A0A2T1C1G0_9CYAN|nr:ABC transporter substrate-binding protein [Merismopedia glauca]PSB02034.1 peptide ABC transporter substrate-binding protein [Merismopedia glauca CCAP 1448/3]